MKIFKSIKWRLQIWYGLILLAVLAGFGFTAYRLEWGRQMRRVDDELHRRSAMLGNVLRQTRPPGRNRPRFDKPPPDQMPDGLPPQANLLPERFELPPRVAGWFGTNQPENFYFVIRSRDGREIARSGEVPTSLARFLPDSKNVNEPPEMKNPHPPRALTQGGFREVYEFTPPGEEIRVGCSIAPELKELHHTAWQLALVGGVILFVGLGGGWKITTAAIRPIKNISATAAKISAGDLSQRINVAETESELGRLAAVLNSTFARLDAAFAQQKQFASDAAHELRTPVSVILTQTQTALTREREAADYKETVEACQRAAQRMRKLIESLLELARLDAGQEQMTRSKFDLAQTVRDGLELVRPLADERGVNIFAELAPLEITGDSERLARVVANLLVNAVQYNRENGEVRLKLETQDGLAVLTVSDTGHGIPAEDLPHVFERFYRGDKSRTGGNAGLGLAIAKAIVEAHGGTIEVASEKDAGTTFTVRLPG
jgi:two-component system, OmpR family, sensor kinase